MNAISTSLETQGGAGVMTPASHHHELHLIGDEQCNARHVFSHLSEPTGADILASAGCPATPDQIVLQILHAGGLEEVDLAERVNLLHGNKFVLGQGDRLYRFTVNGKQYEWPHRLISGSLVLELAGVNDKHSIQLARGSSQTFVTIDDKVDLSEAGVEQFTTPIRHWALIVGGVRREYTHPLVKVADAMTNAGFDITKAWHIFLIVQGHEKQPLELNSIVDLRTPGIEKIRLTPINVGNGDAQAAALRRQFSLLPTDAQYLDTLCLRWETVIDTKRRWLLIHDFQLPVGYTPTNVLMAFELPADYPASQIDMFYFTPFANLARGGEVPSTQVRVTIDGLNFQGWSRHRAQPHPWDPNVDNVRTHMTLVEGCLAKELGQ